jgi:flavin reductase (DIM6/NTAB) family NADH-FMN oxidoreductase RutF
VQESPVQFECKVTQIIALGDEGGANLILCEVVKIQSTKPTKTEQSINIKLIWYHRLRQLVSRSNQGLFEAAINHTRNWSRCYSSYYQKEYCFDGNDLGKLGNIEALPSTEEVSIFVKENFSIKAVLLR